MSSKRQEHWPILRRTLKALALWPVCQLAGCALFDGGLAERTLTGAVFNPLVLNVFDLFFNVGSNLGNNLGGGA